MFLTNVSFEIYNKRNKSPCLFMIHDGPKLPHFQIIFFYFPNSKGINCTPKLCKKKYVIMLFQQLKTTVTIFHVLGLKNNTLFLEWTCDHSPSYRSFQHSKDAQCKTVESLYHKNPMSPFISSVIDHKCQKVAQKKKGGGSTRCQPSVSLIFFPQFDLSCDLLLSNCSK